MYLCMYVYMICSVATLAFNTTILHYPTIHYRTSSQHKYYYNYNHPFHNPIPPKSDPHSNRPAPLPVRSFRPQIELKLKAKLRRILDSLAVLAVLGTYPTHPMYVPLHVCMWM